jgi:Icc-related predicted phosphoesterase
MKISCISDTHGLEQKMKHSLDSGDILIHSGDLTNVGKRHEVERVIAWFHRQLENFNHVIFIAGNHDRSFDPCFTEYKSSGEFRRDYRNPDIKELGLEKPKWLTDLLSSMDPRIHYLENSSVEIDNRKFWGSPITPEFFPDYWAFNYERGNEINSVWNIIPSDVEVLITHGPAYGKLDMLVDNKTHVGCEQLDVVSNYDLNDLKLHVVGHIHHSYGTLWDGKKWTVNASICTETYDPVNPPIILESII